LSKTSPPKLLNVMKITPDDPVLTAYALGELHESDSAVVDSALASDKALAKEFVALNSLTGFLTEILRGDELSLGEDRRAEILKAGQRPDNDVLVLEHRKHSRRQSILVVAGVAAVVVAGFVGLSKLGTNHPVVPGGGDAANRGGGVISADPVIDNQVEGELPPAMNPEGGPSVVLPLHIKPVDSSFVEKSLNRDGKLPSPDRFKVERWVNASQVVSEPKITVGGVGVYSELGPCPWNINCSLLLVNLRPMDGKKVSLEARLNFNPDRVVLARLLGPSSGLGSESPQVGVLDAARTFLYEVELKDGKEQVGSLDLKTVDDGEGYLPLADAPFDEETVSTDFTTARTLAEFAMWGASDARDDETLQALSKTARSLLAKVTNEQTRYALDMILLSEESLRK
jgi:hypothetical protein